MDDLGIARRDPLTDGVFGFEHQNPPPGLGKRKAGGKSHASGAHNDTVKIHGRRLPSAARARKAAANNLGTRSRLFEGFGTGFGF